MVQSSTVRVPLAGTPPSLKIALGLVETSPEYRPVGHIDAILLARGVVVPEEISNWEERKGNDGMDKGVAVGIVIGPGGEVGGVGATGVLVSFTVSL